MENRTIAGTVNANGTTKYGSEFSVSRASTGHYVVSFRPAFAQISGAAATQIYPEDGNTRDNVVIIQLNATTLYLKTGDAGGDARDRDFTFLAVGIGSDAAATKD